MNAISHPRVARDPILSSSGAEPFPLPSTVWQVMHRDSAKSVFPFAEFPGGSAAAQDQAAVARDADARERCRFAVAPEVRERAFDREVQRGPIVSFGLRGILLEQVGDVACEHHHGLEVPALEGDERHRLDGQHASNAVARVDERDHREEVRALRVYALLERRGDVREHARLERVGDS